MSLLVTIKCPPGIAEWSRMCNDCNILVEGPVRVKLSPCDMYSWEVGSHSPIVYTYLTHNGESFGPGTCNNMLASLSVNIYLPLCSLTMG